MIEIEDITTCSVFLELSAKVIHIFSAASSNSANEQDLSGFLFLETVKGISNTLMSVDQFAFSRVVCFYL